MFGSEAVELRFAGTEEANTGTLYLFTGPVIATSCSCLYTRYTWSLPMSCHQIRHRSNMHGVTRTPQPHDLTDTVQHSAGTGALRECHVFRVGLGLVRHSGTSHHRSTPNKDMMIVHGGPAILVTRYNTD